MNSLTPLESLFDSECGTALPLPPVLAALYGRLAFPPHSAEAHVVGNFVTTLDGVVTLNEPGHAGGGDISGFNRAFKLAYGINPSDLRRGIPPEHVRRRGIPDHQA